MKLRQRRLLYWRVFIVGLTVLLFLGIYGLFLSGSYAGGLFLLVGLSSFLVGYFKQLWRFSGDLINNKDTEREP